MRIGDGDEFEFDPDDPNHRAAITIQFILQDVVAQVMLVPIEACNELESVISQYEALMPMIDPTGYRSTMKHSEDNYKAIGAFIRFRRDLEKLREELLAKQARGY